MFCTMLVNLELYARIQSYESCYQAWKYAGSNNRRDTHTDYSLLQACQVMHGPENRIMLLYHALCHGIKLSAAVRNLHLFS